VCFLFQLNNGNACVAFSVLPKPEGGDSFLSAQVIVDAFAECACPFAVHDPDGFQVRHAGIIQILLKGGHEENDSKNDILFSSNQSGIHHTIFTSETISTRNTHGTGCTLSAAITAYMARGCSMVEAIAEAKRFITEAIRSGADIEVGHGIGPVNHSFNPQKMMVYDIE
jgi:hypothetical protein